MSSHDTESRRFARHRRRVPCTFQHAGENRRGFVTDLSARGLFVHTSSPLDAGTRIELTLDADSHPKMVVSGVVVRSRQTHRSASMVQQASLGMGVALDFAPEDYYGLLAELTARTGTSG